MPPLHPAVIHFPIALVVFAFIAELFGYFRSSAPLRAAFWALVGTAISVAADYYDMNRAVLGETHDFVH